MINYNKNEKSLKYKFNKQIRSVLFVTTSFPRFPKDFAGSFVFRFAKYLAKDSISVMVLAPSDPSCPDLDNFENVLIVRYPYFFPRKLQRLAYGKGILGNIQHSLMAKIQVPFFFFAIVRAILKYQNRSDIIHCHWLPTAIAAIIARPFSRLKSPIVFTNWGSDTRSLPKWLSRWTLKRVDGCISTAIETDHHLLMLGRKDFRKIMAPVDEERFNRKNVLPDMRMEMNIGNNIRVIAFVGRLDHMKDPLTFIRACAILNQQSKPFVAIIAGDGELMNECKCAVAKYGLADIVFLPGMCPDTERLLRVASVSVHISPVENTWSNAIAEAMFMEVPVILSDAGYTKHLFSNGIDCLIVPAQDPQALALSINCLFENEALGKILVDGAGSLLRKYNKDSRSIVRDTRKYYNELFARNLLKG